MPEINDICYIIAVLALVGILFSIILGEIGISDTIPIWKAQVIGSTAGASVTAIAALGTILFKDWWDNRINIEVNLEEFGEEDRFGDIYGYIQISARNKSSKRAVVIDSFWLTLQYDGKEQRLRLNFENGVLRHDKGVITFPYELLPGTKLTITLGDSNSYRDYFMNPETGEYNFPESGCNLVAYFEDQIGNPSYRSPPFRIC
jgi:hypothetical protein